MPSSGASTHVTAPGEQSAPVPLRNGISVQVSFKKPIEREN
jgi:hypothetical protein